MNRGLVLLTACLALFSLGCQPPQKIEFRQAPKINKIISLSPSTTEIIGELLLVDKLVGRTASCDEPKEVKSAVVVVDGTKPDFEKIAKIKPELIVYDAKLYTSTDLEKLKESGATVIKMDADTTEDVMNFELELGSITGQAVRASETADTLYSARERARGAAPTTKVRVAIIVAGTGDYLGAGTESFMADVVKSCGGELIGPPGKVFAPMSIEILVKSDPELILVAGKASQVLSDVRLASVSAVKASPQRVYEVPENYLFRPGPKTAKLLDDLSNKITVYANKRGQS